MPPPLTTRRLDLAPVGREDVDVLWAIWREPAVRLYLFDDVPVTRERVAQIVEETLPTAGQGLGLWLARERGSDRAIGVVGLRHAHSAHEPALAGMVEVLVALEPAVWGRGYATEALRGVVYYAFATLELARLVAVVDLPNEASHRVITRLGFTPTGEHQGPVYRARTYALAARDYAINPRGEVSERPPEVPNGTEGSVDNSITPGTTEMRESP